jgi:DNA-binding transcriptional LysR family regulator
MHKIKIRHLETLMVFMKTGSVTEAAAALGTTQPNASKSLKQLEDSIGISLFQRSGGRLQPTPEAEILFTHAARLMEELTFFETLSVDLARLKSGFVQVATLATFGVALLPLVVEAFNTRHPEVFVQIDILDSDKIHSFVSRGNYDLGLVHHPSQEMDLMAQTLRTGSMVCIMPPAHPLARQAGIKASDLAGLPLITYPKTLPFGAAIAKTLADEGVAIRNPLSANHSHVVRKLVERGRGLALVDEFSVWDAAAAPGIAIRPFTPRIPVSIGLIVPKRRPLSLAAQAFLATLQDALAAPPL